MESSKGRAPSRPVIASLIGVVVVIWAINFIAAKIGLRSFPPLTMASFRVCAAGLVMIPFYLGVRRLRLAAFAKTDSVVARLNLSGEPDILTVLSGRERTVRLLDTIRQEVGDDPAAWLPRLLEVA